MVRVYTGRVLVNRMVRVVEVRVLVQGRKQGPELVLGRKQAPGLVLGRK